jgi:hypothetical protein
MKTFYALLIAALFTTAACKKKDEAAKTDPAKDTAAKTAEPSKADPTTPATPTTPDPTKAEPAKGDTGTAGAATGTPNVTVDQAGAKAMELTDKVVKVSADAGDDCAKFGAGLKGLTEDAKAMVANDRELAKDPAKKQEYQTKYEKPAQAKLEPLMQKIEKCMTNADVKAFIDVVAAEE